MLLRCDVLLMQSPAEEKTPDEMLVDSEGVEDPISSDRSPTLDQTRS